MTIRPVDMQLIYQQAQKLQRPDNAGHQGQMAQQQFASEMQKAATERQQIVQSSEDTEQGRLQSEGDGSRRDDRRQAKSKRKQAALAKSADSSRGHHLDIKV